MDPNLKTKTKPSKSTFAPRVPNIESYGGLPAKGPKGALGSKGVYLGVCRRFSISQVLQGLWAPPQLLIVSLPISLSRYNAYLEIYGGNPLTSSRVGVSLEKIT